MDIKIDFGDTDIIDLSMVMKKGPLFQKTNTHGHEYSQPYHHEVFVFTHGSLMHTQRYVKVHMNFHGESNPFDKLIMAALLHVSMETLSKSCIEKRDLNMGMHYGRVINMSLGHVYRNHIQNSSLVSYVTGLGLFGLRFWVNIEG